jgi:hypothetical protein
MKNKNTIVILLAAIILVTSSPWISAAIFGVEASICVPSWYCTAYTQGDCGNRTCADINVCGSNLYKPDEFHICPEKKSTGGDGDGGSSGGGVYPTIINMLPAGYFTVGADAIKLTIEQEKVIQKIIAINSSIPKDYTLEIQYPSSYTKGTDLITTSSNNKYIENIGDFNVIIDTRSILVGTYVVPIRVYMIIIPK